MSFGGGPIDTLEHWLAAAGHCCRPLLLLLLPLTTAAPPPVCRLAFSECLQVSASVCVCMWRAPFTDCARLPFGFHWN